MVFTFVAVVLGKYYEARTTDNKMDSFDPFYERELLERSFKISYCESNFGYEILKPLRSLISLYYSMSDDAKLDEKLGYDINFGHDLMVTYARLAKVYSKLENTRKSLDAYILSVAHYRISVKDDSSITREDIKFYLEQIDEKFCKNGNDGPKTIEDLDRRYGSK